MKAVRIHHYGSDDTIKYEDTPLPEIAPDDVLIKVKAASVNPVDWKIQAGYLKDIIPHQLPLTLGWDVSGVIEAVGDTVSGFNIGDEVYSRPNIARNGTFAEYVAVNAREIALKPKTMDHNHAAGLPLAGLTAYQALFDIAKVQAGQTVLIHAAAGGVGSLAVQMAKISGATVMGTASARNKDFLLELGVDTVIDYTAEKFEAVASDVDMVFDTIGEETQEKSWQVLKEGGIMVSIVAPPSADKAKEANARGEFLFVEPNGEQLTKMAQWVDDGLLTNTIEKTFPLEQVEQAFTLSQTGRTRGKIIIQVA
jgi:NADPH:quinone reductase-like Zn-dependent oxidoreductase